MDSDNEDARPESDYTKLVPRIWTALRLLGVYITIVAACATLENLITIARVIRSDIADHSIVVLFEYFSPKFFADALYLAAGLYLILGGRWLIKNVFLPAEPKDATDEEEDGGGEAELNGGTK